MSKCERCHGSGKVTCSKCGGDKEVKCEKCNGKGRFRNCSNCNSSGKVRCSSCGGTGKATDICPVCSFGEVYKTRWINCAVCHGSGLELRRGKHVSCSRCGGRGQVKDEYTEICPNCHGEYERKTDKPCSSCRGTGQVTCSRCEGTGHAKCQECEGKGKTKCDKCDGDGLVKCPDCEAREKQKEEQKRKAEEKRRKENEAREEAEQRAKERKDSCMGCGCLLALVALAGFLVWWWMEGFTMAALPGMWEQAKNFVGDSGGVAKIVAGLVTLFLSWKVITAITRKGSGSDVSTSSKKRWKFVVLGLLFGYLGIHLAYAKRWFLFLLLWAAFVTGGVMSSGSGESEKPTADAEVVEVAKSDESPKKEAGSPLGGIGFAVWGLLWIGGTLFIKKDGKGNRM